jgi:hypothetical protein
MRIEPPGFLSHRFSYLLHGNKEKSIPQNLWAYSEAWNLRTFNL